MKSCTKECTQSECFINDRYWIKIVFDADELCCAIEQESVRSLVREVLRERFGSLLCFHSAVDDVTRSALGAVSKLLRSKEYNKLSCVLDETSLLEENEKLIKRRGSGFTAKEDCRYWVGEGGLA